MIAYLRKVEILSRFCCLIQLNESVEKVVYAILMWTIVHELTNYHERLIYTSIYIIEICNSLLCFSL